MFSGHILQGKAQELIGICNDIGIEPVVDSKVARMTDVYNRNGFSLRFEEADDIENHFDSSVVIVTMSKLGRCKDARECRRTRRYSLQLQQDLQR